ncbi:MULTISPECIES: hypothetical protein [unclassified Microbacterium]|uniref:hypothetical protein n=1 Tax=unclassified Microbacterium TaxID=2609290 RepID=UPI0003DDF703|nr:MULTISPECIES: hypothetical protein [unclassified Microbacterium]CDK01642.1 hypothetical protein MIC448_800010 [Microbacterium sp. C448]
MSDDYWNDEEPISPDAEDLRLQIAQARRRLYDREKERRDARRAWSREYYAQHREEYLEYQRQHRAAIRQKDPEAYRQAKRQRDQRWRDKHKDEVNAKLREKYRTDPEKHRQRRREHYAANAEEQRARRREYYARNKERQLATQRAWRDREKRRRDAGLPPRRLHRVSRDDRIAHRADADAFFTREWTTAELSEALRSVATPPELVAAFKRDSLRARAAYHLAEQKEELARLHKELDRARPGPKPTRTLQAVEEARLDAIGREVNERLRHREPARHPHHLDPAAPHPMLQPNHPMGMNR